MISSKQEKIVARIEKVRNARGRSVSRGGKLSEYNYLRGVFRAYKVFAADDVLDWLAKIAPSEFVTPVRASWHPLRTIIEATCDNQDLRIKSRWTRAMEFAPARNVASGDLLLFLHANGGIAGCADLASKLKLNCRGGHLAPRRASLSDRTPLHDATL